MKYYQHRFDQVEDYLHHRRPYLLIESIVSINHRDITTETTVSADAFYIQGHFPGAPILPGAMMQEMTTQTAGILIAGEYNPMEAFNTHDPHFNEFALGVLVKVNRARYRNFARPGDHLTIQVHLEEHLGSIFDFTGRVLRGDDELMRNHFRLTNIPSHVLQGESVAG